MRKIHMDHLASFPGAPSILVTPANDNGNTGTATSYTFTVFTATAQKGTATSYSWSLSGQTNGTFSFVGGTTSSTATVQVTGVANGTTASATVRCDAVVNGINDFDTSAMSYQNTTPAYVAAVYPVSSGVIAQNASVTTSTVLWPAGHQTNDVMYLAIQTSNQTIATPTGFTAIYSGVGAGTAGATTSNRVSLFYRRATSGSEANFTIADAGDHAAFIHTVLRGVDTTGNGLDTFASQNQTTEITSFSTPGLTTSVANAFIVSLFGLGGDRTSTPTANTSLADVGFGFTKNGGMWASTLGNDFSIAYYYGVDTVAGTVNATSWSTLSSGARNEGCTLAVKPLNPPPTASFTSFSGASHSASNIGTATAQISFYLNGTYWCTTFGTYCSWAGVLSDYEILCNVSGSGGTFSGTTGSYLSLNTARTWSLSNSSGADNTVSRTLTITIRHATTLTVVVNAATVTLSAESLSDPIGGGIAGIVGVFL